MAYPGSRSAGRLVNPAIFGGLPTLGDVVGYPGAGRDTETYEECQARQDPTVLNFMDPCQGKPHGGFKFPPFAPPDSEPQPGSVRVPSTGFPMAGFPSYRLGDKIQRGDYKGAAGVLVGGVLGSVLGNIISGRKPLDFGGKGMEDEASGDSLRRFKPESGEFLPFEPSEEAKPIPLAVEPYQETLEQNQEVMGPKAQVFPRFADPGDGTLSTTPMMTAVDPGSILFIEKSPRRVREINRRVIPGYDRVREKIQTALRGMA